MTERPLSVDAALRKAEGLARQGQTDQARQLCKAVLARFPSNKRAAALLGVLQTTRRSQAQPLVGSQTFRAELDALLSLHRQGRTQEVLQRAGALAERYPASPLIPNLMGACHAATGDTAKAADCFRAALTLDPGFFPAHNNLGAALAELGRDEEAAACYAAAIRLKPDYAEAHKNLGNALRRLARHDEAIASYARALEIRADDVEARWNLGMALNELGRHAEAVEHYQAALRRAPERAGLHNSLGVALAALGRHEEAIACYREALRLDAGLREAFTNLCELYEKANRIHDLQETVALAGRWYDGDDPYRLYWLAELAVREERLRDAREALERIVPARLPLKLRLKRAELLGKLYDRLEQFDEAFVQFAETARLAAEWQSFRSFDPARYAAELAVLRDSWTRAPRVRWERTRAAVPPARIAFLVGFPRSGTTLLDSVLRGHPDIAVVEEGPMIDRVRAGLNGPATFEALDSLAEADVVRLREVYLDELRARLGEPAGDRLVIDKLPLNLVHAGLIHRLFPEARFILALRHPCDCVLSCFMQNFRLNDAMANFLDLEQAARLYDLAMSLWRLYQAKLDLNATSLRYEDLVADLKSATEPLLDFLELGWDERVLDFRATAAARGRINTPSYNQVTQELYTRASGRWQNYRRQMAPVLPILAPWSATWRYPM